MNTGADEWSHGLGSGGVVELVPFEVQHGVVAGVGRGGGGGPYNVVIVQCHILLLSIAILKLRKIRVFLRIIRSDGKPGLRFRNQSGFL